MKILNIENIILSLLGVVVDGPLRGKIPDHIHYILFSHE
jgi:hypothetical protein